MANWEKEFIDNHDGFNENQVFTAMRKAKEMPFSNRTDEQMYNDAQRIFMRMLFN